MSGCLPLTDEQVEKALSFLDQDKLGKRNKALLIWGVVSGFRAAEILALQRGHIISENGEIQKKIIISAKNMKGKKARSIILNKTGQKYILDWLIEQQKKGLCHKNQYVFAKSNGEQLSYHRVWRILKNCFLKIGLPGNGYATHSLRKTFANNFSDLYYDFIKETPKRGDLIVLLCEALGHSDIRSTQQYMRFQQKDIDNLILKMGKKW